MESKAPSFCRLCNISLASPSVWRQHAKSNWHVYNLRVKVAEPGIVITPPPSSPRTQKAGQVETHTGPEEEVHEESDDGADDESDDAESNGQDLESPQMPQFIAEQCLFCSANCRSFDDNLSHMSRTHSFAIPCRHYLKVDLESLVSYLHLLIYRYRECIQCASRRRTVEGIQHHMTAKGHCRFDITPDMAEFYDMPSQKYEADKESLRLPSGKLLSHPTKATGPSASRTARRPPSSTRQRMALATFPTSRSGASRSQLLTQRNDVDMPLSSDTQLLRIAGGDQQSLAHLQPYQVRSVVATGVKAIDGSQRQAKHAELKISNAGNITLMGTFRADTSKRFRGPWG